MIPADYAKRFKSEGSTLDALSRVLNDLFKEVVKDGTVSVADLDRIELLFHSFLRHAGPIETGRPIEKDTFRKALKRVHPDAFTFWNNHKGGKLLPSE